MKFLLGLAIGIVAGALTAAYWMNFRSSREPPVYTVSYIKSHYPQPGDNSETTLIVYRNADSGHVREIVCMFPPDVVLTGGPNPSLADRLLGEPDAQWAGLTRIRVLEKAEKSGFGTTSYYCEKVS